MLDPALQFLCVRDLKGEVIEADPSFVEGSVIGRPIVGHHRDHEAGRVHQRSALVAFGTDLIE
jgi:hypothetical protein